MEGLQNLLDRTTRNKHLFGISLTVVKGGNTWSGASGNLAADEQFFIASTTKLFTSALIFKLRAAGKLALSDKISNYLPEDVMKGLHIYKGKDYSGEIDIAQLLSHRSGIPDYFLTGRNGKKSLEHEISSGTDVKWDFQHALSWSKEMSPKFKPGQSGKAHYSDTNYQLLEKILEKVYETSYEELITQEICSPLGLKKTYLFTDIEDDRPKHLYFKADSLSIPKAMSSFRADGGIVSSAQELMVFLKAFMNGVLFPQAYINEIQSWNKVFFPLESGIGLQRFKTPWFFSPFKRIPDIIGHSGLSGAFAFYAPEKDIYMTGTVNQVSNPGNSFQLMIKALVQLMKK